MLTFNNFRALLYLTMSQPSRSDIPSLSLACDDRMSPNVQILIDPKKFVGVHSVADAVEHLHSGKSLGKVCGLLALLL